MDDVVQHIESFDDWVQLFTDLKEREQIDKWMWADAVVEYSKAMGGPLKNLASSGIGYSVKTLESYRRTAEVFPPDEAIKGNLYSKRIIDISFSIHRVCSYTENPYGWLELVAENDWSVAQLKKKIKEEKGEDNTPCPYLVKYCQVQKKVLLEPKQECANCPWKNGEGDYSG